MTCPVGNLNYTSPEIRMMPVDYNRVTVFSNLVTCVVRTISQVHTYQRVNMTTNPFSPILVSVGIPGAYVETHDYTAVPLRWEFCSTSYVLVR